jgi:hypothetical protein
MDGNDLSPFFQKGGAAMVLNKGGTLVERGLYWDPMDGHRIAMREDGILPGNKTRSYLKLSATALLILAPLCGMMYVLFLPLFGIGVFLVSWVVPLVGALAAFAVNGVRICGGANSGNAPRPHARGPRKKENTEDNFTDSGKNENIREDGPQRPPE